ncbi:GNAT family N-acetyltransferase [Chachezhania antarctica]|uniref:GNAT family N-acetyltransferase n=1 Tax=Chachezhania antarctica TaxID=2340860 RepID=UPI000EAEE9EE|nr:GNAT family N-acetyltransferase [Chachezhania antarctica]|tara:strand:+ start:10850 stop:11137 length:288 start_codon:yes stop_codon:yes gene_type:complete
MSDIQITREESETKGRFVTVIDGHEAELTYSKTSPTMIIADHTGVPDALGGRGVGTALVNELVAYARETGIKVVPLCPFVKAQAGKHDDWADVFA